MGLYYWFFIWIWPVVIIKINLFCLYEIIFIFNLYWTSENGNSCFWIFSLKECFFFKLFHRFSYFDFIFRSWINIKIMFLNWNIWNYILWFDFNIVVFSQYNLFTFSSFFSFIFLYFIKNHLIIIISFKSLIWWNLYSTFNTPCLWFF